MPNKKKKADKDDFFPESTSTENDIDPLITDSETSLSLRQELKAAIDTMGPISPNLSNEKYSESLDTFRPPQQTYCVDNEQVKELFKNDLQIESEDSQSELDENEQDLKNEEKVTSVHVCPKNFEENRSPTKCYCKNNNDNDKRRTSRLDRQSITKWFRNRTNSFLKKDTENNREPQELYKMFVSEPEDDHSPPRRVVFNLIDELPKPKCTSVGVNTKPLNFTKESKDRKNERAKNIYDDSVRDFATLNKGNETMQYKIKSCECGSPTRVDVYYFDHGNASYLRTTDNPPLIRTEIVAGQSEECNNKFWGEIFGTVHIGTTFITSFILQLFRFLLQSILRPLTVGLVQIGSDYFFKPFLATLFNAVIQPPLIFIYNICTSLRDICDPIAEAFGYFTREIAFIFKSCRFVEIKNSKPCERTCFKSNFPPPATCAEKGIII